MLTCECGDPFDSDWWFYDTKDFEKAKKDHTCKSCKKDIKKGEDILWFERETVDEHGYDLRLDPYIFCSECGEIYLNLSDIGYCLDISRKMSLYMEEYHELTGFKVDDGL